MSVFVIFENTPIKKEKSGKFQDNDEKLATKLKVKKIVKAKIVTRKGSRSDLKPQFIKIFSTGREWQGN